MRANVWSGRNTVQVENVPDPKILNDRDAIVKITSTAICGSDLHLYDGYVPTMEKGDILGHEFMGEIVETGKGVGNLKVGDRVVVPFPIACGSCWACRHELYSVCENSNPNAGLAEKMFGHATAGIFGYSHLTGGYAGGQAEYARVPFADVGPLKVEDGIPDEQLLFLSDILPTGFMGADFCDIRGGETIAVFGAGPVGQFAIASAVMLGAEQVIAIDQFDYRLEMARNRAGATHTINFNDDADVVEQLRVLTGGRGPDAVIDAVGMEASDPHGVLHAVGRAPGVQSVELPSGPGLSRGHALPAGLGHVRLLAGMVRANRPWRTFRGLSSAVVAALATGAYAIINATVWQLSSALSTARLLAAMLIALVTVVGWLIVTHHLWERSGQDRPPKERQLYNAATLLTVSVAVVCGYAVLFVLLLAMSALLIDGGVFRSTTQQPADPVRYVGLAWLSASIATVAGALGSGLESLDEVRNAVYGHDQRRRGER